MVAVFLLFSSLVVSVLVKPTFKGLGLYWSGRVKNNIIFKRPKIQSMKVDAPVVATHLLIDPARALTLVGNFLRKLNLDELSQLWRILKGDMSFVRPSPALFNQGDLLA